jgi:hypothetical protein
MSSIVWSHVEKYIVERHIEGHDYRLVVNENLSPQFEASPMLLATAKRYAV